MSDAGAGESVRRVLLKEEPFLDHHFAHGLWRRYHWPASWIAPAGSLETPIVFAARCRFRIEADHAPIRIHVSADERFELYLDGRLIARGPERGDTNHWFFQSYDLARLGAGVHLLTARVWALGEGSPYAQMSAGPAFLLAAEGDWATQLNTGVAAWETWRIDGVELRHNLHVPFDGFTGKKVRIDARRFPFGFETDGTSGPRWTPARTRHPATTGAPTDRHAARTLRPALLPDMLRQPIRVAKVRFAEHVPDGAELPHRRCEAVNHHATLAGSAQRWLDGGSPLALEPRSRVRVVIDLDDYYCAYPQLQASGGDDAEIQLAWAESLYINPGLHEKGHRDEIEGKYFRGYADEFVMDGGEKRRFTTLWWQAGRYLQLSVRTFDKPLTLEGLKLEETRYPLGVVRMPETDDAALGHALRLARRSLETCVHETFVDCPYYEQLAYVGDTRLQALALLAISGDDRPMRKAIEIFDASRCAYGWTQSRYPCRVMQRIPTFSLLWIGMVHDHLRLIGDEAFARRMLRGVRAVIDACLSHVDARRGVLMNPPGWNFMDWSPTFPEGVPPCGVEGPSASVNWLFVLALRWWRELEERIGEPEMETRAKRWLDSTASAADALFWSEQRGAWAEGQDGAAFSEHAQALAILGVWDDPRFASRCRRASAMLLSPRADVAGATIYFSFYVIEALHLLGEEMAIDERLGFWRSIVHTGLRTLPEQIEPTRSDCHGWGANVLYHMLGRKAASRDA